MELSQKAGADNTYPLVVYCTTEHLMGDPLLNHYHNVLVQELPRLNPLILRTQGLIIENHTRQSKVYMRKYRYEKSRI